MSTEIVPAGDFKVVADDETAVNPQEIEPIEEGDDKKVVTFEEKFSLDNWIHFSQALLKEGRVKHAEIEGEDDDDKKEKLFKQKLVEDPYQERLKPISKDTYGDLSTCWVLKVHGDPKVTNKHLFLKDKHTNDAIISLRSLVWPGMTYVHKDALLTSVYVGDGQKYAPAEQYFPKFPYLINREPEERKEQAEPNGPEEVEKKDQ